MKNFQLTTLISLVALSSIPASAVALPIDFDDSTKIKLIEMGIDALTSDKQTAETSEKAEASSAPVTTDSAPKLETIPAVAKPVIPSRNFSQEETTATPNVASQKMQQVHCTQVQQHCLEVSYSTRSVGVYEGGTLQQTLPLTNGQAIYTVPMGGANVTPYPQPIAYPQVNGYPVAPHANPGGYPAYPQPVYAPTAPVSGMPVPVFQAVPRVSSQQDVMVINIEPKAAAQTIILDNSYSVQGR